MQMSGGYVFPPQHESRKKSRGKGQSSASNVPLEFDGSRFLSAEHEARIKSLEGRTVLSEKRFVINPQGDYRRIQAVFEKRKWDKLLNPSDRVCYQLIREFYANALQPEGEFYRFKTYVRGREISFGRDAINLILCSPSKLGSLQTDEYTKMLAAKHDHNMVSATILKPGCKVDRNAKREPIKYSRKFMTTEAQAVLLLLCYNVKPRLHRSSVPLDTGLLMYCIMEDKEVDIAQIIATEMKNFVDNTRTPGVHDDAPIIFPCLVQALIYQTDILIPGVVNEKLKFLVDDNYLDRFCKPKDERKKKKDAEIGSSSGAPEEESDSSIFGMKAAFNYTWDMGESLNRSNQFNFYCMQQLYHYQTHPAEYTPFPTREAYDAYANWPGDRRPFFSEGASTSGVVAADDDDDGDGDEMQDDLNEMIN